MSDARLRGLPPEEAVSQNLWEVALCVPQYAYSATPATHSFRSTAG